MILVHENVRAQNEGYIEPAVWVHTFVMGTPCTPANQSGWADQFYRWAYAKARVQVAELEARQRWLRSIEPCWN